MKIAIIGKGLFGTAVGSLLEYNHVDFRYAAHMRLNQPADVVVLAVPAQLIRQAITKNLQWLTPQTIFINCSKGIEQDTNLLPHQIVAELVAPQQYFCLMGPSFAKDLRQQQPTLLSLGYQQQPPAAAIVELFATPYCRIQTSPDLVAIEYLAALKNVYAILCGYAHGLGYGLNTRAKLITLALQESLRYASAQNWPLHGADQPGIMGDLVMTCSSAASRNFAFGRLLATHLAAEALAKVNATVEGYHTSASIHALSRRHHLPLPLADLTHTIVEQGRDARPRFEQVLADL